MNKFYPKFVSDVARDTGIPKNRIINFNEELGGNNLEHKEFFNTTDYVHPNEKGQ